MRAKIMCFCMAAMCIGLVLTSCVFDGFVKKSDEELINDRLDTFLEAYNTGDFDGVLACMDAKSRNQYQAMANLLSGIGFGFDVGGFGISGNLNFSDLFGFSVGAVSDGDLMTLEVLKKDIQEEEAAIYTCMTYAVEMWGASMTTEEYIKFEFVKEDGDWFISDMVDFDEQELP